LNEDQAVVVLRMGAALLLALSMLVEFYSKR
jgi:hypothetical protein